MVRLVRLIIAVVVVAAPATVAGDAGHTAFATLNNRDGVIVGRVALQETTEGVLARIHLFGASPGPHAVHIHRIGRCDRPDFTSAGGHFNPEQRQHGALAPDGPHAGDLPNIFVPDSRHLSVEVLAPGLRLADGSADELLDADGAAVVMHAGRDDGASQPAGDAGIRLACGVVHRPPASSW